MENDNKVILISDILQHRARKQEELLFYMDKMKELEIKMMWLRREIKLTDDIIRMIKNEMVIEIKKN